MRMPKSPRSLDCVLPYGVVVVVLAAIALAAVVLGSVMPRVSLVGEAFGSGLMWLFAIAGIVVLIFQAGSWRSRLRAVVTMLLSGIIVVGAASTVERVILVNAATYPSVLAEASDVQDRKSLERLRVNKCKGRPMEIYGKDDGVWIIRCGFNWLEGRTFRSSSQPLW